MQSSLVSALYLQACFSDLLQKQNYMAKCMELGKSYSYIDWIVYDKTNFIKALESAKKQLNKSVELHYESFNDILD